MRFGTRVKRVCAQCHVHAAAEVRARALRRELMLVPAPSPTTLAIAELLDASPRWRCARRFPVICVGCLGWDAPVSRLFLSRNLENGNGAPGWWGPRRWREGVGIDTGEPAVSILESVHID